ncbi:hypothetical protein ABZ639_20270 [Saccharomonospora sp. NPDC006951]
MTGPGGPDREFRTQDGEIRAQAREIRTRAVEIRARRDSRFRAR